MWMECEYVLLVQIVFFSYDMMQNVLNIWKWSPTIAIIINIIIEWIEVEATYSICHTTNISCLVFLSFHWKCSRERGGIKWTRDELKHQSIYPLLLLSISAAARAHLLTNTHYGCCTRPRTSLLKYKKKSKLHSSFLSLQSQLYIAPLSVIHYSSSLLRSLIFCRLFIGNHLWV